MRKNYRISEHRFYHACSRMLGAASVAALVVAKVAWHGFLRPVLILTVGVGLAMPFAHIASRVREVIIW